MTEEEQLAEARYLLQQFQFEYQRETGMCAITSDVFPALTRYIAAALVERYAKIERLRADLAVVRALAGTKRKTGIREGRKQMREEAARAALGTANPFDYENETAHGIGRISAYNDVRALPDDPQPNALRGAE